ncbi:MAG: aminotransferase class I/II-fold pyridoxal phosphate-dependent enzyme, partial [Actinomycetota bacterium]
CQMPDARCQMPDRLGSLEGRQLAMNNITIPHNAGSAQADDKASLQRLFGTSDDLLPLWIAEPYLPLAPPIVDALEERARAGWYGYEMREKRVNEEFATWMLRRHGWNLSGTTRLLSPSLGTSIGAILEVVTDGSDGVILQPPVFTDFKPLVTRAHRKVVRNSLVLTDGRYTMDLDELERLASEPTTTAMIVCNPHNPVGRVWTSEELHAVAETCASHGVFVVADEIHADIMLDDSVFTPFAVAAAGTGVRWAALHGAIKTFGLAGVADSLIVTDDEELTESYKAMSSRLHLTRNNVFALAAIETAYREGGPWLDSMLGQVARNVAALHDGLPDPVGLIMPEGTYLAWLDFRGLGMDVPELTQWLPHKARLALSPGHWFGREGAGFARMSIAVGRDVIDEAIHRISVAVG